MRLALMTVVLLAAGPVVAPLTAQNVTPAKAGADGWTVIFDGSSLAGWRQWRGTTIKGWEASKGVLTRTGPGGDILYDKVLKNFELSLDWNIEPAGNSGIMFHASEAERFPYETAPEMQVLDDAKHPDGKDRLTSAGANYGLYAAPVGIVKPAGEWNSVRLVVRGPKVEQWLNGTMVVSYEINSPDWKARVKASKFDKMPKYGTTTEGYLVLQDHGNRVEYRNIKLKVLP